MANLVRIEPSLFRADEAWFIFDDGRQCLRKREVSENRCRADLPTPMIMSDSIDPIKSMADGRTYDSKSALYRTYRADGNPQGIRYECVGNEDTSKFTPLKRDKAKAMEAVHRAASEMGI